MSQPEVHLAFGCAVCGKLTARNCTRCLKEAFCSVECQNRGSAAHMQICETPDEQNERDPHTKDALEHGNPFQTYIRQYPERFAKMYSLSDGFDSEQMIWLLLSECVRVCAADGQALGSRIANSRIVQNVMKLHAEKPDGFHVAAVELTRGDWYATVFVMNQ